MPGRHAILGPSSAYRWLACTPSARFEEQIPEENSKYSAEGTLAHDLAALVLGYQLDRITHEDYIAAQNVIYHAATAFYIEQGQTKDEARAEFGVMLEHAQTWADLVISFGGDILIETEFDLSEYIPLGFGTADGTNFDPLVIHVSDYKYGAGVPVSAVGNKQMMAYGIGAVLKAWALGFEPKTVVLTICQPRAGGTSSWQISVEDLMKWAITEVKPKALLAIAGQGEFVPGSHCQFCKARTCCAAYFKRFEDVAKLMDKRVMTAADTAKVLTYGPMLKTWVNKVEEDAIRHIQSGKKDLPGFKIVAGKGRRAFRNEDEVVEILLAEGYEHDQIFKPSLRGITELEKELRPKRFAQLFADVIIDADGKPQIAPEEDSRPAIGKSGADEYDEEDESLL